MNFETAKKNLSDILKFDCTLREGKDNAPFGKGVADCLDFSLNLLSDLGFTTKNGGGYYGYGEIGEGELFGILAHLDTVPAGGNWTVPPFSGEEKDGKIFGRGALDDKGPFIACLAAAARLLKEGKKPTKRLRFILGCNEESGWQCMDKYCANEELPVLSFSPDADFPVINCEKGVAYLEMRCPLPENILKIEGGERANMVPAFAKASLKDKEITEHGVSCHGSRPQNGENAIIKLLRTLNANTYSSAFADIIKCFGACDGSGANLNVSDEKSGALTMNIGTVKTENREAVFEIDIRHPLCITREEVAKRLKSATICTVTPKPYFHDPLFVDENHPLVTALLDSYNEVMKTSLRPIRIGGATYARAMPCCVAFGPAFPDSLDAEIHCADEHIDLKEFEKMIEIYYKAIAKLCF